MQKTLLIILIVVLVVFASGYFVSNGNDLTGRGYFPTTIDSRKPVYHPGWEQMQLIYHQYAIRTANIVKCEDTDFGTVKSVAGSVTGTLGSEAIGEMVKPECLSAVRTVLYDCCMDYRTLLEGYCASNKIWIKEFRCPFGCSEGRCN